MGGDRRTRRLHRADARRDRRGGDRDHPARGEVEDEPKSLVRGRRWSDRWIGGVGGCRGARGGRHRASAPAHRPLRVIARVVSLALGAIVARPGVARAQVSTASVTPATSYAPPTLPGRGLALHPFLYA